MGNVNEAAKELVRSYFQAVNDERWDDVMALYHEDAVLHVPGKRPKSGHEQIRPFYEDIGTRFAKHVAGIRLLLAEDDVASATIEYEGSNTDGRPVSVFACDNFVFEAGRIRELRIVFDSARL
jgi:ketosteroid isomerase-like protein